MSVSSIRLFVRQSVHPFHFKNSGKCVCLFMKRPPCKWAGGDLELGGISCLSNCQEKEQKNKPLFNTFWQNTPFSVSLLLVFMTHQTINQIAANLHQISAIAATTVWRLFSIRSCSGSARELEIGTRAGLFCYGYVPFHSIRLCSGSGAGYLACCCVWVGVCVCRSTTLCWLSNLNLFAQKCRHLKK